MNYVKRKRLIRTALTLTAVAMAIACQPLLASGVGDSAGEQDSAASSIRTFEPPAPVRKRGRIGLTYQNLGTVGALTGTGDVFGDHETDTHAVRLDLDYMIGDRWEAHASLPFIRKRSRGGFITHDPRILTVPHPEAPLLDDGNFHSGWQDMSLGLSYHGQWRGFAVTPRITASIPTHEYPHFGNAAIGQNLWSLSLGFDVSRQPYFSNFFYAFGYSYRFVEQTLGYNVNRQQFRMSGGYYFTPRFAARLFLDASKGRGVESADIRRLSLNRTSELWYQHDRLDLREGIIGGVGGTFQINDDYAVSFTAAKLLRGIDRQDLRHAYEIQLSRLF